MNPEESKKLEKAADEFLTKHGVDPRRGDLDEFRLGTEELESSGEKPGVDWKSADHVRLIRLLEGEVAPSVMSVWYRLPKDLQAGIIQNLVVSLEEEKLNRDQLIEKFALLVKESKEFLEFGGPPSDAYIARLPREQFKLRKELAEHLKDSGPSIDQ